MPRNRGLILPLILIGIGVVVLLANTGIVSRPAVERLVDLWPLLLVIFGLQLILNHTLPRQQATLIGIAVTAVIIIAALAYAILAPATSVGVQKVDASAQAGGLTAATLDVNYSAATVDVNAASLGDRLYQVHVDYPGGENPPTISLDHENGRLEIHESSSFSPFHLFGSNRRHVVLTLTDRIPWTIQVGGGAANLRLDLRHLQLLKLEVSGGANRMDAQLPAAKGTVMLEVSGGFSNLALHAPAETQWRIGVSGGANAITINGSTTGALSGDFERQSAGYGTATNRYDIQISGGASHIDFKTG